MAATGFHKTLKWVFKLSLLILIPLWGSGCANGIFYQPSKRMAPTPDTRGHRFESVAFQASDGVALTGWWLPATSTPKGTVIHFHGNAQNMSSHIQYAEWLPAAGYNLFVFDYRGYGESLGVPTRRGLIRDGMAALETVRGRPDVNPDDLFVWGQSLGGTVALQSMMRSEIPIRAAIIDSTFISHGKIVSDKMKQFPWFLQPLRLLRPLLVTSSYDAIDAVKKLPDLPIYFIHGAKDNVIPFAHSQRLHELAPTSKLWIIPKAGHCDAVLRFPEKVRPSLLEFLGSGNQE